MDERVMELLKLCLTAKSQGVLVWFSYAPHCDCVSVYAYKEGWETTPPDEKLDYEFSYCFYLDWEDVEKRLAEVEQAVLNLIEGRSKAE